MSSTMRVAYLLIVTISLHRMHLGSIGNSKIIDELKEGLKHRRALTEQFVQMDLRDSMLFTGSRIAVHADVSSQSYRKNTLCLMYDWMKTKSCMELAWPLRAASLHILWTRSGLMFSLFRSQI